MARLDPHSYADTSQGAISHLGLELTVDFEARTLHGLATLTLDEARPGPLSLDTRSLQIEAVETLDGAALPFTLQPTEGFMGELLEIQRPAPIQALRIRYRTSPEATALQWLEPSGTAGGEHPYLLSQCQPHHARSMVPVQDTPRVRFRYSARVDVPEALLPVMSAAPGERQAQEVPGRALYSFDMPQPLPSYLLALAVGHMGSRDLGDRCRVYAEPEQLDEAAWEFEEIGSMLSAAEELFGPYLWGRFDFVVMPPAFPYGGMENPRLTFLTPTLLAGDRSLVAVLAHELAHSWTGNLVTNATMNDFWLNEGFTVWAERRILEKLQGAEQVALATAVGQHALRLDIERFGPDSPFTRLQNDLAGIDPDEVYSLVPYEKGFLFVSLLEQLLGRADFDALLQRYLETFRFCSITTAEFEAFVEQERPGILGRMRAEEWIRGPGIPDNAPQFPSAELERLESLAAGFEGGLRPEVEDAATWSTTQWLIYLQRVPRPLPQEACRELDERYGLSKTRNAELRCQWLTIAAASAYEPAYADLKSFLESVGRMKFLKPLYRALYEGEATRSLALEIYAGARAGYHPIARVSLEGFLKAV